jgi:hypothetical protein
VLHIGEPATDEPIKEETEVKKQKKKKKQKDQKYSVNDVLCYILAKL